MFPFLVTVILLTLSLPWAANVIFDRGWIPHLPSFLYESTWLLGFITTVIFVYLYRSGSQSHFVQLYLLSMVVKLIACFVFMLLVVLEDRQGAVANVLYFLLVYVIFTAAEIGFLYRKISRSKLH